MQPYTFLSLSNMLEDVRKLTNQINPESLDPNHVSRPPAEKPDEEKSRDYEDTPEFRKSLNMKVSRSVLHPIVTCQQPVDIECTEAKEAAIVAVTQFRCRQPIVMSTRGQ